MRICVIGGANADITATTLQTFVPEDSNPGTVRLSPGGVARNIAHNLSLLGDEVIFLTLFADDAFGRFTAESCRQAGIDIHLCDTAPAKAQSCFLSINDSDGEMIGGVSDMTAADYITPEWLSAKLSLIGKVDVFVADANIPVDSLSYLIDNVDAPLYFDAVSGAKAPKIQVALEQSEKKSLFVLKCNQLEGEILSQVSGISRRYVSLGADGIEVVEGNTVTFFPALPCQAVNTTGAGDALMAGIIHAGTTASMEEAARIGLRCAKITVECIDTVNNKVKELYEQTP
ncbi:MAG: hypothetical protein K6A41_00535 [Bacteroidales bacterium]|nr:hypothetical protein [Bacteroidales bacterium]